MNQESKRRRPELIEASTVRQSEPAEEATVGRGKGGRKQVKFTWTLPVGKLLMLLISLTAAVEFHGQLALSTNWEVMREG